MGSRVNWKIQVLLLTQNCALLDFVMFPKRKLEVLGNEVLRKFNRTAEWRSTFVASNS